MCGTASRKEPERSTTDVLDRIRFVPTPASSEFLDAIRAGQWPTALQVTEEHWPEIWFSLDPTDLRQLLSQAPRDVIAQATNASFLARSTGYGEVEDLLEPEPSAGYGSDLDSLGRVSSDLRLRGRPVQAMSYIRKGQQQMRAQQSRLMDGSGGFGALGLVQAAITALLANEPAAARGMLLQAVNTHRADRFPFVVREARAKLALTYAAGGDVIEAVTWAERARQVQRSQSWVEALIDDTLWLTDYLCAIEALDPAAEDLRRAKPSPLQHREFWPIALAAQVRHLTLTNRHWQARELCATVSAADLPQPGSDGAFGTAVSDARLAVAEHTPGAAQRGDAATVSARATVSRTLHLFTTGQYQEVLTAADRALPPTYDARHAWALRLLRAQARCALDPGTQPQRELAQLVEEILQMRMFSILRYLTEEAVDRMSDTAGGARAAELIGVHQIPTVTSATMLESPLSTAEVDAMRLLQQGLSRKEIAQQLFVSVNTIKSQLASAYRKLGVSDRVEALRKFSALGR